MNVFAGDRIVLRPAWHPAADFAMIAVEDAVIDGTPETRVLVCCELGLPINPTEMVRGDMIAEVHRAGKMVHP
jgi:hypothetical protein